MVGKCGTHQAALAAKNGVIGRAAAAAAADAGENKEFEGVTENAVRLFKYLVPQYYEDFKVSVAKWVQDNLDSLCESLPQAAQLQVVYTKHVISDELVALCKSITPKPGEDMAAARKRRQDGWVSFVLTELLHVDDHPTLTRFFTFRICVDHMLTMVLLNLPQAGLVTKSSAREVSQKRLKKVRSFFAKPSASQALRRASLILQLTGGIEAFMSRRPREGEPPTIVAIQKYKAHDIVDERLQHLLENMHYDTCLNLGAATTALFGTAGDLIVRINGYMRYPYRFVRMCRKWFPLTWRSDITSFLQAEDSELDVGFSLPLQAVALAQDGESCQRAFMESDAVQDWLLEVATALFLTSLDAERQAAEVKRREGRNVSLLANVSRDLLCTRFTRQRDEQARAIDVAAKTVEALKISTWKSIAWETHGAAPQGKRFQNGHGPWVSHGSATGGHASATGGTPATSTSATFSTSSSCLQRRSVKSRQIHRRRQATGGFMGQPQAAMGQPQAAMAQPKAATGGEPSIHGQPRLACRAELQKRREEASSKLHQLLTPTSIIPCTRFQWAAWVRDNAENIRMRTPDSAAPLRRRELNRRLCQRPGLPRPCKRLQPQAEPPIVTQAWTMLLALRTGWYGLQMVSQYRRMFYTWHYDGTTYVVDLETCRVPGSHPYNLNANFRFSDHRQMTLSEFESAILELQRLRDEVVDRVYAFHIEGSAGDSGGIRLRPVKATLVTEPVKLASKGAAAEDPEAPEDECEDLGETNPPSDLEKEEPVVDTDQASGEESESGSSFTSDATEDECEALKAKLKGHGSATGGHGSATGGHGSATGSHGSATGGHASAKGGASGPCVFENGYFWLKGNELDLKMFIYERWLAAPPHGIGRLPTMTKTITPSTLGESRDKPTRSMLCLRAWMLFRVNAFPGWVSSDAHRERLFIEEADRLYADVCHLQPQADGLLGNKDASKMFQEFVPDLAAKLLTKPATGSKN